jgi:hypothetical protein
MKLPLQYDPDPVIMIQQYIHLNCNVPTLVTWFKYQNFKSKVEKVVNLNPGQLQEIERNGFIDTQNSITNFR